jgi:hypothetical protein
VKQKKSLFIRRRSGKKELTFHGIENAALIVKHVIRADKEEIGKYNFLFLGFSFFFFRKMKRK